MNYREELFKALTAGIDGVFRDKSIDALVEVCRAARKEGYNEGFENGNISDGTFDEKVKEAYENGLNVAWECARKIFSMPVYDVNEIFPECQANIYEDVSALEAIERIKEYEEEQKKAAEIKIGDEVADNDGWKGVVTWISPDGEYLVVTLQDGSALRWKKEHFKKTGRHFPQIAEVLKQMQEGEA